LFSKGTRINKTFDRRASSESKEWKQETFNPLPIKNKLIGFLDKEDFVRLKLLEKKFYPINAEPKARNLSYCQNKAEVFEVLKKFG
jgi:hypothetical protein